MKTIEMPEKIWEKIKLKLSCYIFTTEEKLDVENLITFVELRNEKAKLEKEANQ